MQSVCVRLPVLRCARAHTINNYIILDEGNSRDSNASAAVRGEGFVASSLLFGRRGAKELLHDRNAHTYNTGGGGKRAVFRTTKATNTLLFGLVFGAVKSVYSNN